MKTILITMIVVLVIIIIAQGCNKRQLPSNGAKPMATSADAACPSCFSNAPLSLLDANLAKYMASLYTNDVGKNFIDGRFGHEEMLDAKSIWFDLETLKSFIGKIEDKFCGLNCDSTPRLGVRIYFAKYPANMRSHPDLNDLPLDFANRHTIFLVPTYNISNGNIDFDPAHLGPTPCRPKSFANWFQEGGQFSDGTLILSVQNHGDMAPPPPGAPNFAEFKK